MTADVVYVCSQLDTQNQCMQWVQQSPSMMQMIALSQEQAITISQHILTLQAVLLAGLLVIKLVKRNI